MDGRGSSRAAELPKRGTRRQPASLAVLSYRERRSRTSCLLRLSSDLERSGGHDLRWQLCHVQIGVSTEERRQGFHLLNRTPCRPRIVCLVIRPTLRVMSTPLLTPMLTLPISHTHNSRHHSQRKKILNRRNCFLSHSWEKSDVRCWRNDRKKCSLHSMQGQPKLGVLE